MAVRLLSLHGYASIDSPGCWRSFCILILHKEADTGPALLPPALCWGRQQTFRHVLMWRSWTACAASVVNDLIKTSENSQWRPPVKPFMSFQDHQSSWNWFPPPSFFEQYIHFVSEGYLPTCFTGHSILSDILKSLVIRYEALRCARVYQISGAAGSIDWDKNRKEDFMLKIQSKSRATSAASHLGLICRDEVWSAASTSDLRGEQTSICIQGNIITSRCLKLQGPVSGSKKFCGAVRDFWRVNPK